MKRLVVLLVGGGVLLVPSPAVAAERASTASITAERQARAVLERAATAGRALGYSGTQYFATWRDAGSAATLVDVTHRPGRAAVVREQPTAGSSGVLLTATASLDPRIVPLLADRYDLVVAGSARCAGRSTSLVEARRSDGSVAGRFWIDEESGLLLRREVYDDAGMRLRSSAFVDVDVRGASSAAASSDGDGDGEPLAVTAAALRAQGWDVPEELPHGFRLFDTRLSTPRPGQHVLHLAYSDGLSTTSLFSQTGRLGTEPVDGFVAEEVGERPVWVRHELPERVVWSGGGHVWTLVSDASADVVHDAVAALPRDRAPSDGVLSRLGRGISRLGSILNPFD